MITLLVCDIGAEGSVKVLSTAKDNWVPESWTWGGEGDALRDWKLESVDDGRLLQAAWIHQYIDQQEEV
jgi:ATP-dependent RNA helicase DHX29